MFLIKILELLYRAELTLLTSSKKSTLAFFYEEQKYIKTKFITKFKYTLRSF